jgi:hypothetical protein
MGRLTGLKVVVREVGCSRYGWLGSIEAELQKIQEQK